MKRILVVDDEEAILALTRVFLERGGYEVGSVNSGEAALSTLKVEAFDLLVLDIFMPDMNGIDFLNTPDKWKTRPKIVVMTGDPSASTSTLQVANNLGADRILLKPFSAEELLEAVRELIGEPG